VTSARLSYGGYRYPAAIIAQAVRLFYRFPLSYRGVEELLCERSVVVSYESIRAWCLTFGPAIAAELKRRRPQPKGKWHLDDMFIKMNGPTATLHGQGTPGRTRLWGDRPRAGHLRHASIALAGTLPAFQRRTTNVSL
jgi:hypothetical protein